jgi:hypothetical protein
MDYDDDVEIQPKAKRYGFFPFVLIDIFFCRSLARRYNLVANRETPAVGT